MLVLHIRAKHHCPTRFDGTIPTEGHADQEDRKDRWLAFKEDWCIDKIAHRVVSVAILVSLPAVMGIQRLEVGFGTEITSMKNCP